MSVNNWKGFKWDNNNRILDISFGNIGVQNNIYFRNKNNAFEGTFNTLLDKPKFGQQYKFSTSIDVNTTTNGYFRFNKNTITSSTNFSINNIDNNSDNISEVLNLFHQSNNSKKSIITITNINNYNNKILFEIESLLSENNNVKVYNIKMLKR